MDFRILGPLEVDDRGRRLPLRGPRQRALLASLLLARAARSSPRTACSTRSGAASRRRAAAPRCAYGSRSCARRSPRPGARPTLTTRSPGYVLEVDAGQVDALRFERLLGEGRAAARRRRRRRGRGDAPRGARALARARAGRVRRRAVRRRRERQARGAAHPGRRGAGQGGALARPAPGARGRARRARRRASVPRAAARTADAGALSLRPAGGGARGVPRRAQRLRRGARDRADPPAAGAGAERSSGRTRPSTRRRSAAGRPPAAPGGERKLATVLVAAPAGCPEDSDPERSSALLERFRDSATDEIESCGGHVETFAGDTLTVAFGAPVAHEDHTPRALHAALSLQRRVADDFGGALQLRVGIDTGELLSGGRSGLRRSRRRRSGAPAAGGAARDDPRRRAGRRDRPPRLRVRPAELRRSRRVSRPAAPARADRHRVARPDGGSSAVRPSSSRSGPPIGVWSPTASRGS